MTIILNPSLATIMQASLQDIFDTVAKHLLNQNIKSTRNSIIWASGAYRGFDGTKCAAGCLISDEEYRPEMEGQFITSLLGKNTLLTPHGRLLQDLQRLHDRTGPSAWRNELNQLASKYNLSPSYCEAGVIPS